MDTTPALTGAIQRYFDLMYDCDVSRFDQVFEPSSQLHGFREGRLTVWPATTYRQVLAERQSPKSTNARREEQILMLDFASPTQALAKVRVRIGSTVFVDYLVFHRVGDDWRITSKAYHVESTGD